jgi:putative secretion ATPase (PEP-CTERM system associated)
MYERFYELRERPFALSPDPDYLYPSRVHREALDYLRYGLESQAGFIVITGEIGSGKTTLVQTLLRGLDSQTTVGRIVNTILEPRELLETIVIDFGLDPAGRSKPLLLRDLAQYLVDQRLAGRLVLLVIDEAQNLSFAALEELRMLSNLETEKSKLLQIVLVGQPNLREKLVAPELEQLRQRITVSYHLSPLDPDETANYINHRLRRAALGAPLEFPRDVTALIHARSRGVPRIINVICDAALVFGYAEERRQVDSALMRDVMVELEATGVLPSTTGGVVPERGARTPEQFAAADTVGAPASVSATTALEGPMWQRPTGGTTPAAAAAFSVSPSPSGVVTPSSRRSEAAPLDVARSPEALEGRMAALEGRMAALDQREQLVARRERELAEQRRVLAEEYRLLRAQRPAPQATPLTPSATVRLAIPQPTVAQRFESTQPDTSWGRVKRFVLGHAATAVEDT